MLAFETDLDVVCTLHDAIYVNCREEEVVEVVPILTEIMDRAVERVIGTTVRIEVGVKVYTHEEGYRDQRGDKLWPVSSTCSRIFSPTKQPEAFGRLPDPSGRTNRTAPVGWALLPPIINLLKTFDPGRYPLQLVRLVQLVGIAKWPRCFACQEAGIAEQSCDRRS